MMPTVRLLGCFLAALFFTATPATADQKEHDGIPPSDSAMTDMLSHAIKPDQLYRNPVDGKTYWAPGGWHDYGPQQGENNSQEKRKVGYSVRLLNSDDDIRRATTVDDLALFIKSVGDTAERVFAASERGGHILVQFDCLPDRHDVRMVYQGEPEQALLQSFYDQVNALKAPPIHELPDRRPLVFQVEFSVAPTS